MGSLFKKVIHRFLRGLGYEVTKAPGTNQSLKKIERKALRPKERQLSRLASKLKREDNQKKYDLLLNHFVPDWNIPIDEARFVGRGFSLSGFNSYRKIKSNNQVFFEKVYFNSFADLSRIVWLHKNLYALINKEINIPAVQKIYEGNIISIVYFDFFELEPLTDLIEREKALVQLTKDLYKLTFENRFILSKLNFPFYVKNYRNHFQYDSYAHLVEKLLHKRGMRIEDVERLIDTFPKVITHSDIYHGNTFKNKTLIDWDSYGYYPLGFDIAFAYCRLHLKRGAPKKDVSLDWLHDNYYSFVRREEWEKLQLSFAYFLLIFAMEYIENQQSFIEDELFKSFRTIYLDFN